MTLITVTPDNLISHHSRSNCPVSAEMFDLLQQILPFLERAEQRGEPNAAYYVEVITNLLWPKS